MNSTDFERLKLKIARQVFAIAKFELIEHNTLLSKKQIKEMEGLRITIKDADSAAKEMFKKCGIEPVDRKEEKRGPKVK